MRFSLFRRVGRDVWSTSGRYSFCPEEYIVWRQLSTALTFKELGQPEAVLSVDSRVPDNLSDDGVLVHWLAAPINPADINQVQGTYGIRVTLPAIPGNEGVGVVQEVGPEVKAFSAGDRVVPAKSGLGTWQTKAVYPCTALHKIPSHLSLAAAATLAINPPTAFRLLEDVVKLEPGDVIIQNGANSFVGQLIIQFAAQKGLRTINVVRDRPRLADLRHRLIGLGANLVTTEGSLHRDLEASDLPKPKLAINAVGGRSAGLIARCLGKYGTIVTYGGLSREPVSIPTGPFIFKGITARGFWLSGGGRTEQDVRSDVDRSVKGWLEGAIQADFDFFMLEEYKTALAKPKAELLTRKTILLTPNGRQVLDDEAKI